MLHNPDKKTKIDLPEELLCAYVDGQTTPQEDREMLEMLAADDNLAMMHDDLETIMEIINMEEEEAIPVSDSQACVNDDFDGIFDCDYESVDICHYSCCPSSRDMDEEKEEIINKEKIEQELLRRQKEERLRQEEQPRPKKIGNKNFSIDERTLDEEQNMSFFKKLSSALSWNGVAYSGMNFSSFDRITPSVIRTLRPNEIFVFGSNPWGLHDGGASKLAKRRFGAIQGQGEGRQGQSYAIPTIVGGVDKVKPHVNKFIEYAKEHPELHFLVTRIGCGTAGFNPEDIAPLFIEASKMTNVSLPQDFWDVIINL